MPRPKSQAAAAFFNDVKVLFDKLQSNGVIGSPAGRPAYAYIRVSSADQAEDGRSGLPRQLEAVHEVAARCGYSITWDQVFAEDHSGFEFEDRLILKHLRREYPAARGEAVVMEHIDRLSRNADWHQGYLLHEMQKHNIEAVFWKDPGNRIERAVLGAVAQDGMERSKAIMHKGMMDKARSGRVTARTAAFGYRIVDDQGVDADKSTRARRMTYYAVHDEQAAIVRGIYQQVAAGGTLRSIARGLQLLYPPPGKMAQWEPTQLRLLIKNPVYKGEFAAHRTEEYKHPADNERGYVIRRRTRPPDEWVIVPVPAIVSADVWQAANDMLAQNLHDRGRHTYLLAGFLRCAECGYSVIGKTAPRKKHLKRSGETRVYRYYGYACSSRFNRVQAASSRIACTQGQIAATALDEALWRVVVDFIQHPEQLLQALDEHFASDPNVELLEQIAYLEAEIAAKETEDARLYKAYMAEVFDVTEYSERRKALKQQQADMQRRIGELHGRVMSADSLDKQKSEILQFAQTLQGVQQLGDAPVEVKRRVLKVLVDNISLNVREGTFDIEGRIPGTYSILSSHMDRDSLPGRAENLRGKSSRRSHG